VTDPAWYQRLPADERADFEAKLAAACATGETPQAMGRSMSTPGRDGYTISVYIPAAATEAERDRMFDAVADAAHGAEGDGWDVHVVGVPGDPLGICHEPETMRAPYSI
jgi:hypothetical protein